LRWNPIEQEHSVDMISHTLRQELFNEVDDATGLRHHQLASADDDDQQ